MAFIKAAIDTNKKQKRFYSLHLEATLSDLGPKLGKLMYQMFLLN